MTRRLPVPLAFRTIRWKLITSSVLAVGIPLIAMAIFLGSQLWSFYSTQLEKELHSKAQHLADSVAAVLDPRTPDDPSAYPRVIERWQHYNNIRVTIADHKGRIRAATASEDVGSLIQDEKRPGMLLALQGTPNAKAWKNPDYGYEDSMYVNMPVIRGGRIVGAVRVAHTLTQIQTNISWIRLTLLGSFAGYGILIVVLTFILAGSIVRPVEQLNRSAQRLAAGDLTHRVQVQGTDEINHLAETLNQMTDRLQQLEGMRRQYVSDVSHELRTPLAAIRGMAETLQQHGESDPALQERYLPRIIGQTDRLARLASQLLDLAQIESGNLLSSFTSVSLEEVIEEALHACAERAEKRHVTLKVDLAPHLPRLKGDRDRLVQVFLNLVDNAVRYTPAGGVVRVAASSAGDLVTASIADTGQGIPAEHLPHLFERFYRVDKSRSREGGGTGLGLSIVEQIVQAHGGTITVESEVGRGTKFTIRLPLADPSSMESEARLAEAV